MSIQSLIFDVDGTLSVTEEAHRKAFNLTFAENGLDWRWDREIYATLLLTTGGKERMAAFAQNFLHEEPDMARIDELHRRKTARYAQLLAEGGAPLRPGIRELIEDARRAGLHLAVATTTNLPNVDALVQVNWGCPAEDVFETIAAGDMVKHKKPAPDVYELALAQLNLPAQECLAFEDTSHGVASARAAGLRVVAVPSAYSRNQDFSQALVRKAEYSALTLEELLRLVA